MRPFLQYTVARLALFLVCWGIAWLVGAKGVLGVLIGLVVSGLLGYIVLDKLRGRLSAAVSSRAGRMRAKKDEGREKPVASD
ncbi:MAG: DUF4229 domain-containing protein [Streptosporangiales bacterium]|nr:DUF4229 domain-containing protein [Streptosporangiales bacterium]